MFVVLQSNVELFYKFSPPLLQSLPDLTVDMWITKRNDIDAAKLIPTLARFDFNKHKDQVVVRMLKKLSLPLVQDFKPVFFW